MPHATTWHAVPAVVELVDPELDPYVAAAELPEVLEGPLDPVPGAVEPDPLGSPLDPTVAVVLPEDSLVVVGVDVLGSAVVKRAVVSLDVEASVPAVVGSVSVLGLSASSPAPLEPSAEPALAVPAAWSPQAGKMKLKTNKVAHHCTALGPTHDRIFQGGRTP